MKRISIFLSLLALVAVSSAELAKYKDWVKSPEAYFLTSEERSEWSAVSSDEAAEKFITSYWAKRGGQRFKDEIARRITAADEQFRSTRQKGSQSLRGRLLIVLGVPSRVTTARAQVSAETAPGSAAGQTFGQEPFVQTWIYEKDKFDASWEIGELRVRILVDPSRGVDEFQGASPVEKAMVKVAEKSIANPVAAAPSGAAPSAASGAPASSAAAPAAPPPPPAVSLPASVRSALEGVSKEPKDSSGAFWAGTLRSVAGEPYFAVQMSIPSERAPAGVVKFGGIVTSDAGREAASYWEDATLSDSKTGAKTEKVFERSIALPAGSYLAVLGLFAADGTSTLVSGAAAFRLAGKTDDFEISPLLLANTVTPLAKRPGATDPFVFGTQKPVHVAPKANHLFAKEESLWYFFTVTNPKLAASAATTPPAATTPAAPSSSPTPAAPPAADAAKPRVMTRIGVLRNGQPAFAPYTSPAELQPLGPGYYAAGSEIPLATFEPGYYTFTLNIRDMNAPRDSTAFKGLDLKADFVVLKPDGGVPEKPAPPTPAKAKPPAKKS